MSRTSPSDLDAVLAACLRCHTLCLQTIHTGLEKGLWLPGAGPIKQLFSCAKICHFASEMLALGSGYLEEVAEVCASVCEETALELEGLGLANAQLKRCIQACHQCAREVFAHAPPAAYTL